MPVTNIPNNSLILYSHYWVMNGQELINTYMYRITLKDPLGPPIDYEEEAFKFMTVQQNAGLAKTVRDLVSTSCTLDTHDYQAIAPSRYYVQEFPLDLTGVIGGTPLPQNVSQVITRKTALAGRRNIGSVHIPPPGVAQVNSGQWTVAHFNMMDAYGDQLIIVVDPPLALCTHTPVMWTRTLPAATAQQLQLAFPQRTARVMGRRTVGRGI